MRLAEEAGFSLAVSNRYGHNTPVEDRYALRRIWIDATDTLPLFRAKVDGTLDGLRVLESRAALRLRRWINGAGNKTRGPVEGEPARAWGGTLSDGGERFRLRRSCGGNAVVLGKDDRRYRQEIGAARGCGERERSHAQREGLQLFAAGLVLPPTPVIRGSGCKG
ncbi:MAG: hypothetical protein HC888_19500 [Candidatus Competibacteraceae bacterium]|nr:hypothetical protein [Candidatus Competibacteraceae bacterium]